MTRYSLTLSHHSVSQTRLAQCMRRRLRLTDPNSRKSPAAYARAEVNIKRHLERLLDLLAAKVAAGKAHSRTITVSSYGSAKRRSLSEQSQLIG